ncbi:MAG: four helix bundle protein [Planctomycetota bacterium]|jgi:four helix bundle protein
MGITHFTELEVFKNAYGASQEIFKISKEYPEEEKYSLTSQIRKSTRSVCANIAEACRKRRYYEKHFVSKLSDADAEAGETQVWLLYSKDCGHMDSGTFNKFWDRYDKICAQLVLMMDHPEKWCIGVGQRRKGRRDE